MGALSILLVCATHNVWFLCRKCWYLEKNCCVFLTNMNICQYLLKQLISNDSVETGGYCSYVAISSCHGILLSMHTSISAIYMMANFRQMALSEVIFPASRLFSVLPCEPCRQLCSSTWVGRTTARGGSSRPTITRSTQETIHVSHCALQTRRCEATRSDGWAGPVTRVDVGQSLNMPSWPVHTIELVAGPSTHKPLYDPGQSFPVLAFVF